MQTFPLNNMHIQLDEPVMRYAAIVHSSIEQGHALCQAYLQTYHNHGSIITALAAYEADVRAAVETVVQKLYDAVLADGVTLTREDFVNIYCSEHGHYKTALAPLQAELARLQGAPAPAAAPPLAAADAPPAPPPQPEGETAPPAAKGKVEWVGGSAIVNNDSFAVGNNVVFSILHSLPALPNGTNAIEQLTNALSTRTQLLKGVMDTVIGLHIGFTKAVNDAKGEIYYKTEFQRQEAWGALTQFRQLDAPQKSTAVNLLVSALQTNPLQIEFYTEYLLYFGDERLELEALCDAFYPFRQLLPIKNVQVRNMLRSGWLLSPYGEFRGTMQKLDAYANNYLHLTRDEIALYWDAMDTLDATYQLRMMGSNSLFYRYNGAAITPTKQPEFEEKLTSIGTRLAAYKAAPGNEAMLAQAQKDVGELTELYDQNYRTVEGVLYPTREEADTARTQLAPLMEQIASLDFNDSAAVAAFDQELATKPQDRAFGILRQKLARQAALSRNITAFLADLNGRQFNSRQEMVYYLTSGRLMEQEAQLHGIIRSDLSQTCSNLYTFALTVFGQSYATPQEADKAYYTGISHAKSYLDYLIKQNNPDSNFLSKTFNDLKGSLYIKNYEAEYNQVTNGGQWAIPALLQNEQEVTASYWNKTSQDWAAMQAAYKNDFDPLAEKGALRLARIMQEIDMRLAPASLQVFLRNTCAAYYPG